MLGPSSAFTFRSLAAGDPFRLVVSSHTFIQHAASVGVRAPKASRFSPEDGPALTAR